MIRIGRVALVVNLRARKGEGLYAEARQGLDALGIAHQDYRVEDPAQLEAVVRTALATRPDALILGGGDGTVSSVVDLLVKQEVPLGLLPFGTANSFARSLGLPIDLDEALNIIAAGHVRRVDLGRVDGDYFANCAAMGMAPLIASSIPAGVKRWGGRLGYVLWSVGQLARFRPFKVRIDDVALDALEVRIANGGYQGGAEIAPEADVTSGEIVVQVVAGSGRRALVRHWLAVVFGLGSARHDLREFRGRALRIEADPPQWISIDGEVLASTPVTASVAAAAIPMIVPPSREG